MLFFGLATPFTAARMDPEAADLFRSFAGLMNKEGWTWVFGEVTVLESSGQFLDKYEMKKQDEDKI